MKKQTIIVLFIYAVLASVFNITANGQNTYYIKSACGKYLTLQNLSINAGTPIVLSDFNASLAQQWKTVPKSNMQGEMIYYIQSVKAPNRVMDVAFGKNEDGTRVNLYDFVGGVAQEWMIISRPEWNGQYILRSMVGWKNLDKGGGPCTNNTPLMIWTDNRTPAQMWYLEPVQPPAPPSPPRELETTLRRTPMKKSFGN